MMIVTYTFLILVSVILSDAAKAESNSFVDPMRHDAFVVTEKSFDALVNRQRNAFGVTALLHYSSKDTKLRTFFEDIYNIAAKELKGMARFGAIDCDAWTSFCKQTNSNLKYPTVIVYPPNPLPFQILTSTPDKKTIINTVLKYIPGIHVNNVTAENIDSFITQNIAVPKVLLFSSKDKAPVMLKALANAFVDRVTFGFVAPSEKSFETRFKIKKRPTIIIHKTDSKRSEFFKGEMTFTSLHDWINVHAETFVKGGGFSADESLIETIPKPWLVQKVPELTGPSHQDVCFRSASTLCVIYLADNKPTATEMAMLEKLSEEYPENTNRGAKFRWGWMNLKLETAFAEVFGIPTTELPSIVVVNPHKRLRFARLLEGTKADDTSIKFLLEKINSGDGKFTIIKGNKLPPFAVREEPLSKPTVPVKEKEEL